MKTVKAGIGVLLAVLVMGCNPLKLIEKYLDQIVVVSSPEVLEVHGGKVNYSFKGKIPPKAFHKKALAVVTPVIHYNGKTLNLESKTFKGESVEGAGIVVSIKNGAAFELSGSFDYSDDMEGKDMYVDLEINVCKAGTTKCQTFKKEKVARGIITTSKSVKSLEVPYIAGNFNPIKKSFQRSIYFLINRWEVRSTEAKGEAANQLGVFASTPRILLQGIAINSYASPDGELKLNQNLTQKRSESSYAFLTELLKKSGSTTSKEELYKKAALEEDWNGLRQLVSASNLPDKAAVLGVIDSKESNDDKEKAIKAMESWPTILNEMMPKLRRSDVILEGIVANRTFAELSEAAKTSIGDFTAKELLLFAAESKDDKAKIAAYEAFVSKKPKSFIGYNNLAAVYISAGEYDKAQRAIDNGQSNAGENDTMMYNAGILARVNGDLDLALSAYDRASRAGIPVGYNRAIIHIIRGDYETAVGSIPSTTCDYNAALAQLLAGDFDEAISKINCQKNLTADDYYLKAIAYARKGDLDELAAALGLAIKANAALATKATNDMEFYSYFERAEFVNVVK
ncbi:MAG: tetratricopeptide repeat protein [Bacteroidetes bacterium]|nr:tetratricopeptide repeat protein [Bacteroidota bacterium]